MSEAQGVKLYRKIELINLFMEELGFQSVETMRGTNSEGIIYWLDGLKGFYNYKTKVAVSFEDAQKLLSLTVFLVSIGIKHNTKVPNYLGGRGKPMVYVTLKELLEILSYCVSCSPLVLGEILGGYKGLVYSNRKRKLVDQANNIVLELSK
ncbi:aspartate dehydrogenase [Aeromonas phage AhSzq-1]|uniref:Aspartate dehydrogenase n=1 Tax=Aeromonas phage AhSzq-1 TaxID=2138298 RepID=A0A2R4ALI0_9CAUD|nr:aspartate dehydrogenase [Aeromonas phage AhSzq-1]AVR75909.1 aspartate dehydrogenase [Aeromonas phage AhSzq-1]